MTDRELLELAATAAGVSGWRSKHGYWNMTNIDGKSVVCCNGWAKFNSDTGEPQNPTFADAVAELNWNPLTDDGDALRLAAKLGLGVIFATGEVYVGLLGEGDQTETIEDESEPYAATRRAIVRAAAEIGALK